MGMTTHEQYFQEAGREAQKARCKRAKCGSVVVLNGEVVGRGFNAPAGNGEPKCGLEFPNATPKPKSDRTCCMHAEWRAILGGLARTGDLKGGVLYFTRVDQNGTLVPSGEPYCTVCSRLALDVGLTQFALWHEGGIRLYDTVEYNDLSYAFHLDSQ